MEYELANYDVTVTHVNHYSKGIPLYWHLPHVQDQERVCVYVCVCVICIYFYVSYLCFGIFSIVTAQSAGVVKYAEE